MHRQGLETPQTMSIVVKFYEVFGNVWPLRQRIGARRLACTCRDFNFKKSQPRFSAKPSELTTWSIAGWRHFASACLARESDHD